MVNFRSRGSLAHQRVNNTLNRITQQIKDAAIVVLRILGLRPRLTVRRDGIPIIMHGDSDLAGEVDPSDDPPSSQRICILRRTIKIDILCLTVPYHVNSDFLGLSEDFSGELASFGRYFPRKGDALE